MGQYLFFCVVTATQERVFYTVMTFFLSFFAVFAAFLYPNR